VQKPQVNELAGGARFGRQGAQERRGMAKPFTEEESAEVRPLERAINGTHTSLSGSRHTRAVEALPLANHCHYQFCLCIIKPHAGAHIWPMLLPCDTAHMTHNSPSTLLDLCS
jgi:hypothetical protein